MKEVSNNKHKGLM